jgi:hypothetical protein
LSAKVIDFKKFTDKDSGAWWCDSRGVNRFEGIQRLTLIDTPCQNLADRAVVDRTIAAEFEQGIGQLRLHRRLETELEVIMLSDFALEGAVQPVKRY